MAIYDPLIGRFLSADLAVQFPIIFKAIIVQLCREQSLTRIDPTGFQEAEPEAEMEARYEDAAEAFTRRPSTELMSHWLVEIGWNTFGLWNEKCVLLHASRHSVTRDANFRPRGPAYTEIRDSSRAMTNQEQIAFDLRRLRTRQRFKCNKL